MTEAKSRNFVEFSVQTAIGERHLCRVLGDDQRNEPCTVSHPDAGGQCKSRVVYEVYGLPYCETHGLEACFGCLNRLYETAADEIGAFDNPHYGERNHEVAAHLEEGKAKFIGLARSFNDAHDSVIHGVFPYLEDRVDADTLEWDPVKTAQGEWLGETPPDWWLDAYWRTCDSMINAWNHQTFILVDELEQIRQSAAAQYAFAERIYKERRGQITLRAERELE